MARYIDRDEAINHIETHTPYRCSNDFVDGQKDCINQLKALPTADVVEVKHGYWQDKFNRNRMVSQSFCSVCGKHSGIGGIESNRHKPFCPNCGAKMDGERKCEEGTKPEI